MPTPVQHADALLGALETLKRLEAASQAPSSADLAQLRAYPGAGPLALHLFPNPETKAYPSGAWEQRGWAVRNLCTEEEYESLLRSTFSAFYTSPLVMEAVFALLARLGVPDTARVFEPGCGIGNFLAHAPEGMRFVGIELDRLSAKIAVQLWPQHDLRQGDMTGCALPSGLDAAVGNVPFADLSYDYGGWRFMLHEVCLARAIDSLKPSGIAVLVITHGFLDKQSPRFRKHLAQQARFLGAIRLPSSAFADQGTKVVADLVVFQKHQTSATDLSGDIPAWIDSRPMEIDGVEVSINQYFHDHPAMVLGTWSHADRLYGAQVGYSVTPLADLPTALVGALVTFPEAIVPQAQAVESDDAEEDVSATLRPLPEEAQSLPEGSLYLDSDGTICQRAGDGGVQVIYSGKTLSATSGVVGKRVAALTRLRTQAREVLRRQMAGATASERAAARSFLKMQYALFVAQHGPINKTTLSANANGTLTRRVPNLAKFRDDPEAMLVAALEDYDEDTGTATCAAIFTQDVVGDAGAPVRVESAEDALLVGLDLTGGVDVPMMADLLGCSQEAVLEELGDLVYRDPETGQWETADQYLSGNVRTKLAQAQTAGAAYTRNVAALEAVQPPDLLPSQIEAQLGAPWIAPDDIATFLRETCEAEAHWPLTVSYLATEAAWLVNASWRFESSPAMRNTYGTQRADGVELLTQALNLRVPTVRDPIGDGKTVVNLGETIAAREKQGALKEAFKTWLWKDPARTERLVRLYNDLYNQTRLRAFDGAHLAFPGMSAAWQAKLTTAQKDAIWRIMCGGNTLLAHAVGAGKSAIMMAAGMKLRQAGRIRKPVYCIPNHMLEQFIRECLQLYPNARMLLAASEDMSPRKRKLLAARMATGAWDGIITTHSAFERMGMSPAYQARFLRECIQDYEDVLVDALPEERGETRARGNIRKRLEKQKARYEDKLETLLAAEKKDDALLFDECGIDYLFVDECQFFKNLETPSKLENVAGIQTTGSQRAFDLALKLRYLREKSPAQSVTFATGTPISNTMVEMYTMQKYLDPQGLEACGVGHFDAWAATFGEVTEVMEVAVDSRSMRARQRFARFVNMGELQQHFRKFADVRTKEQLRLPVPAVVGGKAQVIACPMSAWQRFAQDDLVARYEAVRAGEVKPWEDNALKITTAGRQLAIDARMVDPDAGHDPQGKLQACAENVLTIYHATRDTRATQLIFCDMGVNPTRWGFSAYETLMDLLVKGGLATDEVRCIQDATSDAAKHQLFEQVRSGRVAVLLGSTSKMGTGTNVQQRLLALHHLDAPWKPAEIEQREGRIVRQGNRHTEVQIYTYVTEGSFDAYMWQTLQTKQTFIAQVMHGELTVRAVQDVDEQALTYAEVKAIATGNPAMLVLARTEAECRRLRVLREHHRDAQYRAQQQLKLLPDAIAKHEKQLAGLTADLATVAQADPVSPWVLVPEILALVPPRTLDLEIPAGETIPDPAILTQAEIEAALMAWSTGLRQTQATQDFAVGTYRGLAVTLRLHSMAQPQVFVRGEVSRDAPIDRRTGMGRALARAVHYLMEAYSLYVKSLEREIEKQQRSLLRYSATAQGTPYAHEAYAAQLETLRQELKTALSARPPTPEGEVPAEEPRDAQDVVADIEALRAAQSTRGEAPTLEPVTPVSIAASVHNLIRARHAHAASTA
jgi:N12 class adenine-specific DNA methylase/SAM-dependent methyltransferase